MAESSYVRQRTEGLARSPSLSALLILADISGYTRFMIASQDAMVHGQAAITMLLEAVIDAVQPPLIVHELEGDAVFVYAERGSESEEACREAVLAWMWRAFAAFRHRQAEIVEATFCPCAVCRNAEKLRLKLLVHSGSVLRHETGGWPEISGVDVILTHRLAKNRVATSEYILMTEPAVRDLGPGPEFDLVPRIEDELVIGVAGRRRRIPLPSSFARLEVDRVALEGEELVVGFQPESPPAPIAPPTPIRGTTP